MNIFNVIYTYINELWKKSEHVCFLGFAAIRKNTKFSRNFFAFFALFIFAKRCKISRKSLENEQKFSHIFASVSFAANPIVVYKIIE